MWQIGWARATRSCTGGRPPRCGAGVRELGLVVFSACSHAGIVNVLTHARASFPDVPIHAVFGGLHLSGPNEQIIPQTVAAMKPFAPALHWLARARGAVGGVRRQGAGADRGGEALYVVGGHQATSRSAIQSAACSRQL